jgi:hypothetical protein
MPLPDVQQIALRILKMDDGPDHMQAVLLCRYLWPEAFVLFGCNCCRFPLNHYGRSIRDLIEEPLADQPDGFRS